MDLHHFEKISGVLKFTEKVPRVLTWFQGSMSGVNSGFRRFWSVKRHRLSSFKEFLSEKCGRSL